MEDRREFLRNVGVASLAAAGLATIPGCAQADRADRAKTAEATDGDRLDRIGVQLYTVRDAMQESVAETLARVAEIGYEEVEFWRHYGHSPTDVRRMLDANELTSPAAHVPLDVLENNSGQLIETAQTIGHHYLIVASLNQADWNSLDALRRTAGRFNRIGKALRDAGLTFGYHNHDYEFQPIENQIPFDVLLEECDPDLVKFEMDLFWITRGGGDPLSYFERHPGRFHCVHIKDMDANGEMVDVGAGEIDFGAIFGRSTQAGIKHYFVEHDSPNGQFASITRSYHYLRQLVF